MSYTKEAASKAPSAKEKSWTDLTGTMKVFGKERDTSKGKMITYSTSIGKKQEDGSYKNAFFNIRFTKNNDPEKADAFVIKINSAFFSVDTYTTKDGVEKNSPVIVVTDFDFAD